MTSYSVTARSAAPRETVWRLLEDVTGWPRWAGRIILRGWWEREGDPPPGGVGAIRRLGFGIVSSREQIVERVPPERQVYTLLFGLPVRGYRATVRLTEDGGGTRIDWSGEFEPMIPGTGAATRGFLTRLVGGFARSLAAAAEREG